MPATGICSLPFCDKCPLREYSLSPSAIGPTEARMSALQVDSAKESKMFSLPFYYESFSKLVIFGRCWNVFIRYSPLFRACCNLFFYYVRQYLRIFRINAPRYARLTRPFLAMIHLSIITIVISPYFCFCFYLFLFIYFVGMCVCVMLRLLVEFIRITSFEIDL